MGIWQMKFLQVSKISTVRIDTWKHRAMNSALTQSGTSLGSIGSTVERAESNLEYARLLELAMNKSSALVLEYIFSSANAYISFAEYKHTWFISELIWEARQSTHFQNTTFCIPKARPCCLSQLRGLWGLIASDLKKMRMASDIAMTQWPSQFPSSEIYRDFDRMAFLQKRYMK